MSKLSKLTLVLLSCAISGCTAWQGSEERDCTYRERDLTTRWDTRSYWCVPDAVTHKPRATADVHR